ncbi:MAG: hypothetical protein ACRDRN_10695, partial [Sciscionella sp.]
VISNGALTAGQKPGYGTLVAPQLYGPNPQHIFCMRLDMMVDGSRNTVYECDSVALSQGPENPHGNAWTVRETPMLREFVDDPVAYKLVPQDSVLPFYQPDAHAIRRFETAESAMEDPAVPQPD